MCVCLFNPVFGCQRLIKRVCMYYRICRCFVTIHSRYRQIDDRQTTSCKKRNFAIIRMYDKLCNVPLESISSQTNSEYSVFRRIIQRHFAHCRTCLVGANALQQQLLRPRNNKVPAHSGVRSHQQLFIHR